MKILKKTVHTYNKLTLAIERWVEKPPPDYLQFLSVWIQMRNIPVNYYTFAAIMALDEFAGQVIEFAFDPLKSRSKEYVRAMVRFDVSKPLRISKVVNTLWGRMKKRCYLCQRLTHEQPFFPLVIKKSRLKHP